MTNLDEATDVSNTKIPVRIAADNDVSESGVVASVGVAGVDASDDGTDSSVLWHGWSIGAGDDRGVVVDVVDEDGDGGGAGQRGCTRVRSQDRQDIPEASADGILFFRGKRRRRKQYKQKQQQQQQEKRKRKKKKRRKEKKKKKTASIFSMNLNNQ